jgi:hypothetical protein
MSHSQQKGGEKSEKIFHRMEKRKGQKLGAAEELEVALDELKRQR